MEVCSDEVSNTNSFCGYCRLFGNCATEYEDHACWEFVPDEFWGGCKTTG